MQLVENKRPDSILIAEISAIRKFEPHFRAQRQELWSVIPDAAKPACHFPAARPAGKDLASPFPASPSPFFRAPWTLAVSGDRTSTACAKGRIFQIANRYAPRKLEFQLNAFSSTTSKFLIDNFKCVSPTLRAHSSITLRQYANSSGAPSFAARAKGGVFLIANRHAARKLEFRLSVLPSITSKFLIDKFLALLNSQENESPA
jgi:hypothetical protein